MKINIQTKNRYNGMINLIKNPEKKIILDIGVGETAISKKINSKKIITLDAFAPLNPDILCDINKDKIPLKNDYLDMIIAGEFIEHLTSPVSFLRECNRILKKHGELILSTPNIVSLKNRFKVLFGFLPEYCCIANEKGEENFQTHIKDFSLPFLKRILSLTGFKIVEQKTNGIIFHSKQILPLFLTPVSFGECLLIRAVKK